MGLADKREQQHRIWIKARGVCITYADRTILNGVDIDVCRAHITTLVGNNGAGKSTLLRVLIGLTEPGGGEVWRAQGVRVGYVPQHFAVDASLPITARRFIALRGKVDRRRWQEAVADTGVEGLLEQPLQYLSGGEMRRVLLARALLHEPDVLALDEPAAGLDAGSQGALYRLIGDLRERYGCGVVVVSHDLNLVMAASDNVLCLQNGRVACRGAPASVVEHPEYRKLFGSHLGPDTAVFRHSHDHGSAVTGDFDGN